MWRPVRSINVLKCFPLSLNDFIWLSQQLSRVEVGRYHPQFSYGETQQCWNWRSQCWALRRNIHSGPLLWSLFVCRDSFHPLSYSFNKHLLCNLLAAYPECFHKHELDLAPSFRISVQGEKRYESWESQPGNPQGIPHGFRLDESQTFTLKPDFVSSHPRPRDYFLPPTKKKKKNS